MVTLTKILGPNNTYTITFRVSGSVIKQHLASIKIQTIVIIFLYNIQLLT